MRARIGGNFAMQLHTSFLSFVTSNSPQEHDRLCSGKMEASVEALILEHLHGLNNRKQMYQAIIQGCTSDARLIRAKVGEVLALSALPVAVSAAADGVVVAASAATWWWRRWWW